MGSSDRFVIRQLATVDLCVRPTAVERMFRYYVRLVYVDGQGCCYMSSPTQPDFTLIGKSILDVKNADLPTTIATMDGAFASLNLIPTESIELVGNMSMRSRERAEFIASRIVDRYTLKPGSRIALIGVVGEFIRSFSERGIEIFAYDLDPDLIGKLCANVTVRDGHSLAANFPDVNVILATAMTLQTKTYLEIVRLAAAASAKLAIYAETAAHLSPFLLKFGADAVFSEPFPFYVFGGRSVINFFTEMPEYPSHI